MPCFTLRTLLLAVALLAVALGWFAWQRHIAGERIEARKEVLRLAGAYVVASGDPDAHVANYKDGMDLPMVYSDLPKDDLCLARGPLFIRRWLGDPAILVIRLPIETDAGTRNHLSELFPEAEIRNLPASP